MAVNILIKYLKKHFGYDSFRDGQEEIIMSILNGDNTLAVMPTGGGKSICYQLPAIVKPGTCIVISPLIALMKDQVDTLNNKGISATYINSSLSYQELNHRLQKAEAGAYSLIYVAPERLESKLFINLLSNMEVSFIAVDEAHCISEWGHDFRPAYKNIASIRNLFPELPIIALTATATKDVQDDIVNILEMKQVNRFLKGFDRPNLSYKTITTNKKVERIIDLVKETKIGSVVIYCASRKRVENVNNQLIAYGVKAEAYHAGMPDYIRQQVQDRFIKHENSIIVATNAFGMGIDKANVRKVIHHDLTLTLEGYYQEAGRAGRDGNDSECYLLYDPEDIKLMNFFVKTNYPTKKEIQSVYDALYNIHGVDFGYKSTNPILHSIAAIANTSNIPHTIVSNVINLFERHNIIRKNSVHSRATMQFTETQDRIREYYSNTNDDNRIVLEALLRSLSSDALKKPEEVDLHELMNKHDIDDELLKRSLNALQISGVIRYREAGLAGGMMLTLERMPIDKLPLDLKALDDRRIHAFNKMETMVKYAETLNCKRNYILEYFQNEKQADICGRCSSCMSSGNSKVKINSEKEKFTVRQILYGIAELDGRFGKAMITDFLKGNRTNKISSFQLEKANYFGACKDIPVEEIKRNIETAYMKRLIDIDSGQYPVLYINENGIKEIGRKPAPYLPQQKRITKEISLELGSKLKSLRNDIARKEGIVPRGILSDVAIRKMSELVPSSLEELSKINGVSLFFVDNYGKIFLTEIRDFFDKKADSNSPNISQESIVTLNMARQGISIAEIAKELRSTEGKIAYNLQEMILAGEKLNYRHFVEDSKFEELKKLCNQKGEISLKEIKTSLSYDIGFAELRVIYAIAQSEV